MQLLAIKRIPNKKCIITSAQGRALTQYVTYSFSPELLPDPLNHSSLLCPSLIDPSICIPFLLCDKKWVVVFNLMLIFMHIYPNPRRSLENSPFSTIKYFSMQQHDPIFNIHTPAPSHGIILYNGRQCQNLPFDLATPLCSSQYPAPLRQVGINLLVFLSIMYSLLDAIFPKHW